MKKVLPFIAIAGLLFSTCKKNKDEEQPPCKTCQARTVDGQLVKEETVCSETEESIFRSKYEGRSIQCN